MRRGGGYAPVLPPEILDMILDLVAYCPRHPWSTRKNPCLKWHDPPDLRHITRLRLVSHSFNQRLIPLLFHHVTTRGPHRQDNLPMVSRCSHILPFIRVLRIELAPKDMGHRMARVNASLKCSAVKKLELYFDVLRIYLVPLLKKFSVLRVLHLTTSYTGVRSEGAYNSLPKGKMLTPCFETMCESVRQAEMSKLHELVLGIPYDGGYSDFHDDIDERQYKRMLKACGKRVKKASLKLIDVMDNPTTLQFV